MTISQRSALIVAAFVAGVLVFLFIQYRSERNFEQLADANQRLLNEHAITDELRTLENDVLLNEAKTRSAVNTGDTGFVKESDNQITDIQYRIDKLQRINDDDSTEIYVDQLDGLVHAKLEYTHQILHSLQNKGKTAAEQLIATQRGKLLTDSIQKIAHNIRHNRRLILTNLMGTVDTAVAKAERSSSRLILFILVLGSVLLWYIINTIRTQHKLLQNIRLSEKEAQRSAQVKENFLANMSHEIRTPMNAILGFTNLLVQKDLDPETKLYVQTIRQSGESLLAIVNDILDISKIEAGMVRIENTSFRIRELIHSVQVMQQSRAGEKKLRLFTEIEEGVPDTLEGDPVRLTQILVNLVNNAIKFTERGSISIQVKNKGREGQKLKLGILVKDTGIGIEKQKLATIFNRFQQADDSITRKYGGTGLGLAIVKNLVDLQNGNIVVQSGPGRGTAVQLMIPYEVSTLQPLPVRTPQRDKAQAIGQLNAVVLIVEDNEVNQSLLLHLFQKWKVQPVVANNGKEAVEILKTKAVDLIIMDIQMPEMDGYTAAQKIRAELKLATPIIAMTAHAMTGEREKCLRSGMNEYLAKPVKEEDLAALIVQLVPGKLPDVKKKIAAAKNERAYTIINLDYMMDISAGNLAYEYDVTEKFLAAIPLQLQALEEAQRNGKTALTRQVAHKMRSTISVMGLNDRLGPYLDQLEREGPTPEQEEAFEQVEQICHAALAEAKQFLLSLSASSATDETARIGSR